MKFAIALVVVTLLTVPALAMNYQYPPPKVCFTFWHFTFCWVAHNPTPPHGAA